MGTKKRKLNFRGNLRKISKLPPSLQRVKKLLDELPLDDAISCRGIAEELQLTENFLQSCICRLGEEYRYREGNGFGYANKETVRLKKEGFYDM